MKRTYILCALIMVCVAYLLKTRYTLGHGNLEAAKERIRLVAQQPVARSVGETLNVVIGDRRMAEQGKQPDAAPMQAAQLGASTGDSERVTHLTKGTFTLVDGTIVYSADAQLDIGHGMLVSSPSGVMVSDAEQQHISGDLVVETQDQMTTMQNAFLTVDKAHVEMTSDSAVTSKKEEPK
jgi:hypothetical protein